MMEKYWWLPEFQRRVDEIKKDPGYGMVFVKITAGKVTFVGFEGQKKGEIKQ